MASVARRPGRLAPFARRLVYAMSLAIIAIVLAIAVGPRLFPYQAFVVLSASMAPEIPVGSVVFSVPVSRASLSVGDVITYQRVEEPDLPVTHRVVALRAVPGGVLARTKGDANDVEDPWEVQLGPDVLHVVGAIPAAGYVLYFAQSPIGRALTIGLPTCLLVALTVRDRLRARRAPSAPAA